MMTLSGLIVFLAAGLAATLVIVLVMAFPCWERFTCRYTLHTPENPVACQHCENFLTDKAALMQKDS